MYSGALYLIGISIILVLRPELMFSKEGTWKEFGLGRDKAKYTWMPFWLFSIIWAILSYMLVLMVAGSNGLPGVSVENSVETNYIERVSTLPGLDEESLNNMSKTIRRKYSTDMKPGYYILDAEETIKRGVPKYVFLGPEAPNLIYKN